MTQQCSLWPSSFVSAPCCFRLTVDLSAARVASLLHLCVSAARRHSASLSAGLYLLLFFSTQISPPSSSSLILFMKGAHSIILSPYIFVCPSFSPHLSAPRGREGGRERRSREGEMDRLGDGDKRSISRPNSRGRRPPSPLAPLLQAPPPSSVPVTFVPCRLTRVH